MTQEAINQILDRARHGDVTAQVVLGQLLCKGKDVKQDIANGLAWLQNAAQCNSIWARELIEQYQAERSKATDVSSDELAKKSSIVSEELSLITKEDILNL